MNYHFNQMELADFQKNIHKEWALTNGIGGYAGSSILGAHNRTHQGYLIACLHPPVSRYLVFSKTNERFVQNGKTYDLTTAQHKGGIRTEGQQYLTAFDYDGTIHFAYQAGELSIDKYISLVHGKNTAAIGYEIKNHGEAAEFSIVPLMNFREHSESSTADSLLFETTTFEGGFSLTPKKDPSVTIHLLYSRGKLVPRETLYDLDMELQTEVDNEVDGLDCHYTPYEIHFTVPAGKTIRISMICNVTVQNDNIEHTVLPVSNDAAFIYREKELALIHTLIQRAGYQDPFAVQLSIAANQFLTYRKSTGYMTILAGLPWFTDWGRDTMISFTGLTLCTGRFQEAHDILLTFAQYQKNGLIPNMFPDDGQEPLYNTVDASLWYFYAVYKYLEYVNTKEAYSFIQKEIYPVLKQIIETYKKGTDFSIYMEKDGLIHAGSGLDQVTWMDVRVGDWVATPRHGKPVEINALWYNALKVMELLAKRFKDQSDGYASLAEKVKKSFCAQFWNEQENCLYDVVDGNTPDDTIRPNQIYAVSLPFTMLSEQQNAAIVSVVYEKLYAGCGLRSLDPAHRDYHPIYLGALQKRDEAYHQGTAWGFLLGGFITAYTKVHGKNANTAQKALALLAPVKEHLREGCIGSISEIFDGDAPNTCRGCYAQAWSVGEVLRCYVEDILPYLSR